MSRSFADLTQEECATVYPELLDNSDRHYKVARLLTENGNQEYGVAVSHLVLSSEELVKAMVIYVDSMGFNMRKVKGMDELFFKHEPRHFVSSIFAVYYQIFYPILSNSPSIKKIFHLLKIDWNDDKYKYILNLNETEKLAEVIKIINEAYPDIEDADKKKESFDIKLGKDIKSIEDEMVSYRFWLMADTYKIRGFYVDYKDYLLTPKLIDEEEYKMALSSTDYLKEKCLSIISLVDNLPVTGRTVLVRILKHVIKKDYIVFFQKALNMIKETKKKHIRKDK
jgi:AbiV family abortive infection protein